MARCQSCGQIVIKDRLPITKADLQELLCQYEAGRLRAVSCTIGVEFPWYGSLEEAGGQVQKFEVWPDAQR